MPNNNSPSPFVCLKRKPPTQELALPLGTCCTMISRISVTENDPTEDGHLATLLTQGTESLFQVGCYYHFLLIIGLRLTYL